jgi:hypothetical protein
MKECRNVLTIEGVRDDDGVKSVQFSSFRVEDQLRLVATAWRFVTVCCLVQSMSLVLPLSGQ